MKLTAEEQRILNGEQGDLLQKFMEILVGIGECFDAPRLVPVHTVHVPSVVITVLQEGGRKLFSNMVEAGLRCKVLTTVNPSSTDCCHWKEMGIPADEFAMQEEVSQNVIKLGAILSYNCTPYLIGNVARYREHIAWGEISAVIYANSVIGARTNPEGAPSGWAASMLGKTPLYGWHLDENRYGHFVVRSTANLKSPADFGALVVYSGRKYPELTPIYTGLPELTDEDRLKSMSGSLRLESKSKMFHAVSFTPDAPTEKEALGGKKPVDVLEFTQRDLEETLNSMNTDKSNNVSWIVLGCPHCSIWEIAQIANKLGNRKVSPNVKFWVLTSVPMKALAERMGFVDTIEKAGGVVVTEACPNIFTKRTYQNLNIWSLATNSVVMAHSMGELAGSPNPFKEHIHLGDLEQCLDAAVSGKWR